MKKILFLILISTPLLAQKFTPAETERWKRQAKEVSITRDSWGIPHINGKTDADAVFGLLYAQCEDDFERVERNYIVATARLSEVEGEAFIYNDLRTRLFIDTLKANNLYNLSPEPMKKLCDAFADGVNYFLFTHPEVKPKLLKRFQPWMPLMFSEGSIGGDIEELSLNDLKEFYGKSPDKLHETKSSDGIEPEPQGSNGFAIAPSKSASGNALLLINPHTSFYFRSEVHMTSQEGLNAYGAVTWGQFFVYQGFNEHCGWMHTSSEADVIDGYREIISKKGSKYYYKYGNELKPLNTEKVTIFYKNGAVKSRRDFIAYRTHHGPIVMNENGKWISARLMVDPLKALTQSYQRTKAESFENFKNTMMLRTNSSNNTVYADDKGNIAYWHGDFMPKRDTRFNWSNFVDGSDPATEWKELHTIDEIVHVYNPASGWIQNCNSTPFTVAGESSPRKDDFPTYMAPDAENERGIHAVRVLKDETRITLDRLITLSRDSYLPGFEKLVPALLEAYDGMAGSSEALKTKFGEPFEALRDWDFRYSVSSVPTTLAIYWGQRLRQSVTPRMPTMKSQIDLIEFLHTGTTPLEKVKAFTEIIQELEADFGTWKQPWGEVNRFQRISGRIEPTFDDEKPSIAVPSTSSFWGSLAAFGSRKYQGTKKMYGSVGNSFVAVVEFGKRVKAKSVVTGGSSSDPASPHFSDQSVLYCQGQFKDVWFYPEDIEKHVERKYRPGE